jgi:hypothetical protein
VTENQSQNLNLHENKSEPAKVYKAPLRTIVCPKCLTYGATMDMRNSDRQVVVNSSVLDKNGKPTKMIAVLEHEIKCPACKQITRKIR